MVLWAHTLTCSRRSNRFVALAVAVASAVASAAAAVWGCNSGLVLHVRVRAYMCIGGYKSACLRAFVRAYIDTRMASKGMPDAKELGGGNVSHFVTTARPHSELDSTAGQASRTHAAFKIGSCRLCCMADEQGGATRRSAHRFPRSLLTSGTYTVLVKMGRLFVQ